MFKLKALSHFEMKGRGVVYTVESPVTAARNHAALSLAIGPKVEIDGVVYEPLGFEMNLPLTPVAVGELIGILVQPNTPISGEPIKKR